MSDTTSPDGLVRWASDDPVTISGASQALADSTQTALSKRERYTFVWADSSERTAQTGMVQGSQGYQIDTNTDYVYDNSVWRIRLQHAEYTSTKSMTSGAEALVGTFTLDTVRSTDSSFLTIDSDGTLQVTNTGVYTISMYTAYSANIGTTNWTRITVGGDTARQMKNIGTNAVWEIAGSYPNARIFAGEDITFYTVQTSGSSNTQNTRVRVTRID